MASISAVNSPNIPSFQRKTILENLILCPFSVSFRMCKARFCAIRTNSDGGGVISNGGADLLRKPLAWSPSDDEDNDESEKKGIYGDTWLDWEDQILEDTAPIVGFVRMILHSGKYGSGDRLSPEHEKNILERLLAYHPECEKKIGCGIDYVTIGYHPNFECSRCLFVVRNDGELVDFSYWKCIKGLIRKNYPLYADSFILRHFRRRRHSDSRYISASLLPRIFLSAA